MTTYGTDHVTCSVCGTASEQKIVTSTNTFFGSPDLDLRPPEMQRSTMPAWLQECPNCGFISADLSQTERRAREIVASEGFAACERGVRAGTFAGRCLKRLFLDEQLGLTEKAAKHALWAAWAADDQQQLAVAAAYRSKASDLFLATATAKVCEPSEALVMKTRTVDVLRRAGRWEDAVKLADELLGTENLDERIRSVLAFGRRLAQACDNARYTVADVQSSRNQPR
jgi:ribosomal protein L32